MRKQLAMLLAVMLTVLVACGDPSEENGDTTEASDEMSETTTTGSIMFEYFDTK